MRNTLKLASGLAAGLTLGLMVSQALASRNSVGTESLPSGNPVGSGTLISSVAFNNTMNDLATETTNSLDRNGRGGMLSPLRGADGTAVSPALSFTSEPGTGFYRVGAGNPALAVSGAQVEQWTSNGQRGVDGAVATPAYSFSSETGTGLYRAGAGNPKMAVSGAAVESWTAAGVSIQGTLNSDNLNVTHSGGGASIIVNSSTATNQASLSFYDQGSPKYQFGKQADNSLFIWDTANARTILSYTPGAATPVILAQAQIGLSGTPISASYRGTVSWSPGSMSAGSAATSAITVTGAVAGADCIVTPPFAASLPSSFSCWVTTGVCNLQLQNGAVAGFAYGTGTWSCRVLNP